jgi:hypothetical protein
LRVPPHQRQDDDITDHAWIQDDTGLYHLFFQNEGLTSGAHIEHYVSHDLQSISRVGVALQPDPGAWDSYALWAPHIVRSGATYYMFYTGTSGPGSDPTAQQRIGLMTSTDLVRGRATPRIVARALPVMAASTRACRILTTLNQPSGSYNHRQRSFVLGRSESPLAPSSQRKARMAGVITVRLERPRDSARRRVHRRDAGSQAASGANHGSRR